VGVDLGSYSDFAAARMPGANSDSASDVPSLLSGVNSAISTSNSSALASSLHTGNNMRNRSRLSPVSEGINNGDRSSPSAVKLSTEKSAESYVEIVAPIPKADQPAHVVRKSDGRPKGVSQPPTVAATASEISFPRSKVVPIRPLQSALTAMMASSGASSNPFAENYAAISGRAEVSSTNVQVYFPNACQPAGKAMVLNVRQDASVEEVIGFALWSYWEAGWLPKLDEGLRGEEDPLWGTKLSAIGWIMRIAEEDGEVDDEFPRKFSSI
jgi:hypothetical protein